MTTCHSCKYSSVHNGMQACAWKSGLASNWTRCEKYERDWEHTILVALAFFSLFIFLPAYCIYLTLIFLGVI